ncbi:MAG: hypothetical protein M1835_001102 [Candelina submexicana]|nr:MAG: hypothetical protein M1835_001102 [Candelina submexicana]
MASSSNQQQSQPSNTSPQAAFSLLMNLPPELQEQILGYLLLNRGFIVNPACPPFLGAPRTIQPAILHVNRSLYEIGAHLLYTRNTFRFHRPSALLNWLNPHRPSLRHVCLELDFRISIPYRLKLDYHSPTFRYLHEAAPKLKSLVLYLRSFDANFCEAGDLRGLADMILKAGIRNLKKLTICGLPRALEEELMEYLKPMMEEKGLSDPARISLPPADADGL